MREQTNKTNFFISILIKYIVLWFKEYTLWYSVKGNEQQTIKSLDLMNYVTCIGGLMCVKVCKKC